MRTLSDSSRTEDGPSDEALNFLQTYLWGHVRRGWDPMRPNTIHWSHDDNTESQRLGFIIAESPSIKGKLEVIGLGQWGRSPQAEVLAAIARMSSIDPLCAKAIRALTVQKLAGETKL